ncbi:hypothetical protein ID866_10640, partial [Astraeus odoratus]
GIIAGSVQLFFAWRVYVLSRNIFIVAAILLCSCVGFFGALGTTIAVRIIPAYADFHKFESIVIVSLAGGACANVLIVTSLVLHLKNRKNEFPTTSDTIDRIIRLTMQTGLITMLCAVIALATFLSMRRDSYLIFHVPLPKLYTNSLMSSLNSRGGWRYNMSSELGGHYSSAQRGVSAPDLL